MSSAKSERPSRGSASSSRPSKALKAKKAVVKAVRKGQLLIYVMGGANLCYAIALLGAVCFNGLFDADNKWVFLRKGPWQTLHAVAVAICVLSIFGLVAAIVATFFRMKFPEQIVIEFICWISSYVLAFITLILEGVAIANSRYGDDWVPDVLAGHRTIVWSEYNFRDTDSAFDDYVKKYEETMPASERLLNLPIPSSSFLSNRSGGAPVAGQWGGDMLINKNNSILPAPHNKHILIDAMQPYGYRPPEGGRYDMRLVPPCLFDWDQLAPRLTATSPCDYPIANPIGCVGKWTASKFKEFWCEQYEQIMEDRDWKAGKSFSDIEHRAARRILPKQIIDSVGAWNQMNGYLLGLLVVAFIISAASVFLDLKYRKNADQASSSEYAPKA